jgi:hypothetical protein
LGEDYTGNITESDAPIVKEAGLVWFQYGSCGVDFTGALEEVHSVWWLSGEFGGEFLEGESVVVDGVEV